MNEIQEALAPYLSLPKLRRLVAHDAARLHEALRQPEPPAEVRLLLEALAAVLEPPRRVQIDTPAKLVGFLLLEMALLPHEELWVVCLNTKNYITAIVPVYVGTLNSASVRICEVFRPAIQHNAAVIILAHNHPSGDPTPSPEDVCLTRQLVSAGNLLDLPLMDHLVIGRGRWVSLRACRLGFEGVA